MNEIQPPNKHYSKPEAWTDERMGAGYAAPTAAEVSVAERMGFIRKVYSLFFVATLFAIGGVFIGFSNPELMIAAASHPWIALLLLIGGVFVAQAVRHQKGINLVAFFGFTTLTGVIISPLLYIVNQTNFASIVQAGVLTIGIFGGLTVYVFISDRDFSFMRGMLTVGLIVVILAGFLNVLIVGSGGLGFAVAAAALLLFSGYVLYDTSNIIRRYPTNEYIAGAMDLYLDAFNIFLALIRILNAGRR
ncbi:MAG TPA: Bax inhibitor-1/YccA family protein [Blastocatellia bacterium]|nr:Bax inhibitor-1/YccA family protein [Blastocatellia bacterium]